MGILGTVKVLAVECPYLRISSAFITVTTSHGASSLKQLKVFGSVSLDIPDVL